jgi:glycosyltransferase involved in cell wall biosynthesis
VPVLVSRIPGSLGLLGDDYPGVFPVGDDAALAALIVRCRDEPGFLASLRAHCAAVAPRFEPARERAAVRALVRTLLEPAASEDPVPSAR